MLKSLNLLSLKIDRPGKSRIRTVLLYVLVFLALLPMTTGIGTMAYKGQRLLSEIQQEGLILVTGFSAVSMTVFFFSIFYVMSVFYFSKDIESLLPLPLKPSEILAAKFTVTLLYEYLTELLFLAPVLIGFGAAARAGFMYYLYSIAVFLILPVLPIVYASVLGMLAMRFTNISRNKDRFRIVGGTIALILAVGVNAIVSKLGISSLDAEQLRQLMEQGNNSLVGLMAGIFFSNKFAVIALLNSRALKGFVNLAIYVLISALFVMLFLNLGESIYFKGVIGISESFAKREKFSEKQLSKSSIQKSVLRAHTMKELKLLFRTPVYFINCVLMNFIFPIFIILPYLVQPDEMKSLQGLSGYIASGRGSAVVLAAVFGMSVFVASTNGITATAISREGTGIFVSKYLPVSYKTQIMAKVLSGMSMGAVGTLSLLLTALLFFRIPAYLILLIAIASILGITFSSFVGILFDLNFPKLVWDNEQKAVKQNFNVVLNMLANVVIAGIPVFISIVLHFTLWTTFLIIVALFGILDILLYKIISTVGVRLFAKIEI